MSKPAPPPKKKNWPRWAISPAGDRARFDCPGDVMPGWTLETPLPGEPAKEAEPVTDTAAAPAVPDAPPPVPPKNKGGRRRKAPKAE